MKHALQDRKYHRFTLRVKEAYKWTVSSACEI